ncbi:MAG: hypothetical protein AAGK98_19595 [Pseudomonadota bacterium]
MTDVHTVDAGQGGHTQSTLWDLIGLAAVSFGVIGVLGYLVVMGLAQADRLANLEAEMALRPPVVVADVDVLLDHLRDGATRTELAPAYDDLQARIAELEEAGVIVLAGGSALARPLAHRVSVNPDLVPAMGTDGSAFTVDLDPSVPADRFSSSDNATPEPAPELTPERAAAIFRSLLDAGILDDGAAQ